MAKAATLQFSPTEGPSPAGSTARLEHPKSSGAFSGSAGNWGDFSELQHTWAGPLHPYGATVPAPKIQPWHPQCPCQPPPEEVSNNASQVCASRGKLQQHEAAPHCVTHLMTTGIIFTHNNSSLWKKTRFSVSQSNKQLPHDKPDTSYEIWIASVLGIRDAQKKKNRFRNKCFSKSQMKPRQLMLSKGSIVQSANCPDEISEPYSKINGTNRTQIPLETSEDKEVI